MPARRDSGYASLRRKLEPEFAKTIQWCFEVAQTRK
jgi:hypothetical protein